MAYVQNIKVHATGICYLYNKPMDEHCNSMLIAALCKCVIKAGAAETHQCKCV